MHEITLLSRCSQLSSQCAETVYKEQQGKKKKFNNVLPKSLHTSVATSRLLKLILNLHVWREFGATL